MLLLLLICYIYILYGTMSQLLTILFLIIFLVKLGYLVSFICTSLVVVYLYLDLVLDLFVCLVFLLNLRSRRKFDSGCEDFVLDVWRLYVPCNISSILLRLLHCPVDSCLVCCRFYVFLVLISVFLVYGSIRVSPNLVVFLSILSLGSSLLVGACETSYAAPMGAAW